MRILILLLIVCGSAQAQELSNGSHLPGFVVFPSSGDGWSLQDADAMRRVYQFDSQDFLVRVVANAASLAEFTDDQSFLVTTEERQEAELEPLEMLGLHYNYTSINGMACFQYDGTFVDDSIDGPNRTLNRVGFVCRHPTNPSQGIDLEFEHRAESRLPSDMERLRILATDFARSAVLVVEPGR